MADAGGTEPPTAEKELAMTATAAPERTPSTEIAAILGLTPEDVDQMTEAEVQSALSKLTHQEAPALIAG